MEQLLRILSYTLPAGRLYGIPLRINWLLLLFVPSLMGPYLAGLARAGDARYALFDALLAAAYIGVLYGSIVLHELGHCWGYRLTGIAIREIQLTPFGGVAVGDDSPRGPRAELLVVALGPAVSALLALAATLAAWGAGAMIRAAVPAAAGGLAPGAGPGAAWWIAQWVVSVLRMTAALNTTLLLFNLLIPVFPLDGARLWRAGLSLRFHPQRVTLAMARIGLWTCGALALAWLLRIRLPVLGDVGPWMFLMMIFGVQECLNTLRMLEWHEVYPSWHAAGSGRDSRPLYFEGPAMEDAARMARRDLGPMAWLAGGAWSFRFRVAKGPVAVDSAGRDVPPRAGARTVDRESAAKKRVRPAGTAAATGAPPAPAAGGEIRMIAPDPATLSDPVEVRKLMNAAARAEDFALAARLKKRLAELEG